MKLYRGYFPLEGKKPTMKWNRENVKDEGLLTLEQAGAYEEYGAPLTEDTALVDIDDAQQSRKLLAAIRHEKVKCRVIQTDRGLHFLFNNKDRALKKCGTHVRFAVGLSGDVKVGSSNSYEKLKSHGTVRPCIYGQEFCDTDDLDPVPEWLKVIGAEDKTVDFPHMNDGDGRNTALFNHSFNLQKRGFSKSLVEKTCFLLNNFVFDEPLEDAEYNLVTREESLKVDPTFAEETELPEERRYLLDELERTDKGFIKPTIGNAEILIRADSAMDSVRRNLMSDAIEKGNNLPWGSVSLIGEWTDDDDSQLRKYMERYANFGRQQLFDALTIVANDRAYHPVKDYLEGLPEWDGVERADRILVDFLGAEDSEYVRQVTRKTLCAAIKRIYDPGCKFDTMLVLNGRQGLGKSTLIARLGGQWFSDALKLSDLGSKACEEKIQGMWIEEIGELAGLKKIDIETLRSFITRTDDYGRAAYGRRAQHKPRQCVFFGTTNAQEQGFLRDIDGNRRFWVVDVAEGRRAVVGPKADLGQEEIDQIWAEILVRYKAGEETYLTDDEVVKEAERIQNASIEADPRQAMIEAYLETPIPEDWYSGWTMDERIRYFKYHEGKDGYSGSLRKRQYVTYMELWTEGLGEPAGKIRLECTSLAAIMRRIGGWKRSPKSIRIGGQATGCFVRDPIDPRDAGFR